MTGLAVGLVTRRRALSVPRFLRTGPALIASVVFWILLVVACVVPSLLAPGDPLAIHSSRVMQAPNLAHVFGTDEYGRDVLGVIIHGAAESVLVGVVSTVLAAVAGTLVGVVSGYIGGWVDTVVMRIVDVLLCFPGILLALVFQAALGPGRANVVVAVAVAAAPQYARLVRGLTLGLRERTFVVAAHSAGVRSATIVRRHILPFLIAPVLSIATIGLGTAIVLAATLSFLGLGDSQGVPDWGASIGSGEQFLSTAWWIVTFPGVIITLVVVSAGIVGDAIGRRLSEGGRA